VDIGDEVKEGQVLAVISAPDLDAQLEQAKAQVEQYKAAQVIAKLTFDRQKQLLAEKVAAQQDFDQADATLRQSIANVDSSQANVQSLQAQQSFEKILAPFDGTITARYLNVGALLSVGTSISTSPSIFQISASHILRVFIFVPQAYVSSVKVGDSVKIVVPEYPQEVFTGKVTRIAKALDPSARTERVEIQVPDENGKLKPGMYLDVTFTVGQDIPALMVPPTVLDIRAEGTRVVVVDSNNKVKFRTIILGRDFGTSIEVLKGLEGNERLIQNPSTDLRDGDTVVPITDKK
jgi:RND family efflux transporter MFP subunit